MTILHKFQQHCFGNGFQTHDSILDITPYDPEVIFIGTFNHGFAWNNSDFYYGRGMYMWTCLGNLFLYNNNHLIKQRNLNNNEPNFEELFEICKKGRFVFADIVKGIKANIHTNVQSQCKRVFVNDQFTWTGYKDRCLDLLGKRGWLDDNVTAIIKYINEHKTIKHIYFTFKSGDWLRDKIHEIEEGLTDGVSSCSIFTPTGNGFGENLTPPFNKRAWSLTHCWVWNGLDHIIPISRLDYGHLDHDWLRKNVVEPNNF